MVKVNPDQRLFILGQVFSMSMMATAQRGRVYREGVTEHERLLLRAGLQVRLEQLLPRYVHPVCDSAHLENIENLAEEMSSSGQCVLRGARFRIGSAQKVLNLYLKYFWCLGEIATPPHCPFDSLVLARVPKCQYVRWTQLDSMAEYARIVDAAREVAGDVPLAEWELRLYNEILARPTFAIDFGQ